MKRVMIGLVDSVVRVLARERVRIAAPAGVELRRSRLIPALGGRLSGLGRPAAAVALGRTIVLYPGVRPTARLLRHELVHVAQWERQPYSFPFRYVGAHIRHGYDGNPYEVEARAAEAGPARPGEEA